MHIYYGVEGRYRDVTYLVLDKCVVSTNNVVIPADDNSRCALFGDPVYNVLKHIKVVDGRDNKKVTIYDHKTAVILSMNTASMRVPIIKAWHLNFPTAESRLEFIHNNVLFSNGNVRDEYPEQLMVAKYLAPTAKVLEIGANYGRNTLTIAALLEDERNFVALECDQKNASIARINRDLNNYKFGIEVAALSTRKLYQREWYTYTEEEKPVGATEIATISWPELQRKYDVKFDTLVADCEGALYHILKDIPSLLDNINLVIVENDYASMSIKHEVDAIYRAAGLSLVESKEGGWGPTTPCLTCFYEVWKK